MAFRKLLDSFAKSSAQAVVTLSEYPAELSDLKKYLYIETDIERDFKALLNSSPPPDTIIFLCGSSGDGKSELLRRYYHEYLDRFAFHLDATHSFQPDQNAIEALDQVFDKHRDSDLPLVVGINVGMLFNYAASGADRHSALKASIEQFTLGEAGKENNVFLNFDDYPKFSLKDGSTGSAFISDLLERVTSPSDSNPLYVAYLQDCQQRRQAICDNFRLLQVKAVREIIVTLLLHARLRYDQFLSARTLLDFVNHLICGPGTVFDNLFLRGQNELSNIVSHFDPCSIRTKAIDQFLVQQSLAVSDPDFQDFKNQFRHSYGFNDFEPSSWLRAFYVLSSHSLGNNYHQQFREEFQQPLFDLYVEIWRLHQKYSADPNERQQLRRFYQDHLISGLMRFGNRRLPSLTKRHQILLSERNGIIISAAADVRPDLKRINSEQTKSIHDFHMCLKIGDVPLPAFPINVSFLELIMKINNGYRPNKHDKNTIVILEELIEEITVIAKQSKTIYFTSGNTHASLTNDIDDEEFVVGDRE